MTIIRSEPQIVAWLKARIGKAWIVAEDGVPIEVHGHCAGIVARAAMGHAAGYLTANDIAHACVRAGVVHQGAASNGVFHLWTNDTAGHIATQSRPGTVICNVRTKPGSKVSIIQEVPLTYFSKLKYVGWVHGWDVPSWGPIKLALAPVVVAPKPVIAPKPTPALPVVVLAELKNGAYSTSAGLVNVALVASGDLDKKLQRGYWSLAAQAAFRRYRKRKGFKPTENRAAFVALGAKHFTVR